MRSRSPARQGVQEEHRDVHVAVIGADELVGAADEREILLARAVHGLSMLLDVVAVMIRPRIWRASLVE
jgi:hypothetical protein